PRPALRAAEALQQTVVDRAQEGRGPGLPDGAVPGPRPRVGQVEPGLGPRHADEEEPTFLGVLVRDRRTVPAARRGVVAATLARQAQGKQAPLAPDREDDRELQPLGG